MDRAAESSSRGIAVDAFEYVARGEGRSQPHKKDTAINADAILGVTTPPLYLLPAIALYRDRITAISSSLRSCGCIWSGYPSTTSALGSLIDLRI